MANGNVTATTADKWIRDVWSKELNVAIELDLVIAKLFVDKSAQLPDGDVFHLPASHNLTANTKSAGSDATAEALTETEQTFTVSTHQVVAQLIEDFASIQSMYDMRSNFNDRAGYALARAMDVSAAALLDDNTTQTVGTLGSELSLDNLLTARKLLRNSAAKGPFIGVVAPATYNGYLKIEQFTNNDDYGAGPDAITRAKIGTLFDQQYYESQLTTGTSPQSYGCVWSTEHFFKIIQRKPSYHALYAPLSLGWQVTADQIYGVFERQEADEAAAVTTVARLWNVRLAGVK